jgi:glycosyltransferase involved in cell wall biosynthesis
MILASLSVNHSLPAATESACSIGPEVLIDVTRLIGRFMKGRLPTGIDRVGLAYIGHYRQRARALVRWTGRAHVLSRPRSQRLFDRLLSPPGCRHPSTRTLVVGGICTAALRTPPIGALMLNTGHSGLEHPAYRQELTRLRLRPVFLLHDLIPITHPEYCRPGEAARHRGRLDTMLAVARGIITNSTATLSALSDYAQTYGLSLPPAVAAPLASGLPCLTPGARPLAAPYFVFLSTIEPRKNHWLLLHVWRDLVAELGDAAPRLVVIGQRGWECENVVDLLERCAPLNGMVIERPGCSDAELVTWLYHAQALVFPSFVEGFGMPVVEALSLGVPVILSDLSVFAEVAGPIPEYIAPLDGPRWRAVIESYSAPSAPARAAQLERIQGFRAPTWAGHFARVDPLLEQISGND